MVNDKEDKQNGTLDIKEKNNPLVDSAATIEKPEPKRIIKLVQKQIEAMGFSGPIPPPDLLAGYEKILPGSAERILKMAENQALHRQAMEKRIVFSDTLLAHRGLWFAFAIVVLALVMGGVLIFNGKPIGGFSSIITALVMIVGSFVYKKHHEKPAAHTPHQLGKETESLDKRV